MKDAGIVKTEFVINVKTFLFVSALVTSAENCENLAFLYSRSSEQVRFCKLRAKMDVPVCFDIHP